MLRIDPKNLSRSNGILTTGQIAKYCQVDARTVNRWINQGILKSYSLPITKFNRVKISDFIQFLKEQKLPIPEDFKNLGKIRVLIVDDDLTMAKSVRRMLTFDQGDGFDCEIATSGFEAGKFLQKNRPDLAIVDLMMPDINGFQVCKQIKSDPETRHIKIIAISGVIGEKERREVLEAGADSFLQKPFDEETLKQCAWKLLRGV